MKTYTDLEQSKKLAEILPIGSNDMYYYTVNGDIYKTPNVMESVDDLDVDDKSIPCWSLATLLGVLPSTIIRNDKRMFLTLEKAGAYNLYYKSPDRLDELWETKEEPVDACVAMIEMLYEFKML